MSDFIGLDVQGIPELKAKLDKLPEEARNMGADESYKYLLDVLRQYPPEKRVTRVSVYGYGAGGKGFKSVAQRRYFFWALAHGVIDVPYNRTQKLRRGWKKHGEGYKAFLANETPYAQYVQQRATQNKLIQAVGWQTIEDIIEQRIQRIVEKFNGGVKKAIHKLKLD